MPLGLIGFEVDVALEDGAEDAGEIPFSLLIDDDIAVNGFWKQTSDGDWVNLASPEYGGQVSHVGHKTRLDFVIQDNGPFDSNPAAGAITDPGAPGWRGLSPKSYFDDVFVADSGTSFDGAQGRDMAFFEGELGAHLIVRGSPTATVQDGDSYDTLHSVEVLLFGGAAFDEGYYLSTNPDVAAAVNSGQISAREHFITFGYAEGRVPNAEERLPQVTLSSHSVDEIGFDATYYLEQNPDVAAAVANGDFESARQHFDRFGQYENRDPNALFHTGWYLEHYPDVAAAVAANVITAYAHYRLFGGFEGRSASDAFSSSAYLYDNPDVAAAGMNPLEHFLMFGVEEGRFGLYVGESIWG
jgi:hypothetical protein